MKGIVLAGGTGSRLWPITWSTSKQLLPVYDKPLIHYPIATLMSAGIRDIVLITTPKDHQSFFDLLGDGSTLGVNFVYKKQNSPDGIAQAFLIASDEIRGEKCALILGDNLFHGKGLGSQLGKFNSVVGAQIFAYRVSDPERYGVVELDEKGNPISIVEKPKVPKSNYAITGLYFYDEQVLEIAERIEPSSRGELEISTINQEYLNMGQLGVKILERGTAWLDTGTFESLHDASSYVRALQDRQGLKSGCLEEIAFRNGWISKDHLLDQADNYKGSPISLYLRSISGESS